MGCTSAVSRSWEDNAQNCPLIRSLTALSGGKTILWLVIVRTLAIFIFLEMGSLYIALTVLEPAM